jgi:hypothetical protein
VTQPPPPQHIHGPEAHQVEREIAVDHVHQRESDQLYQHRAVQAALVVPQPPPRGQDEVPEGEDIPPEPEGRVAKIWVVIGGYEGAADCIPTLLEVPPKLREVGGDPGGSGPAAHRLSLLILPDAALSPPPGNEDVPSVGSALSGNRRMRSLLPSRSSPPPTMNPYGVYAV